jgi:hypothetical protein
MRPRQAETNRPAMRFRARRNESAGHGFGLVAPVLVAPVLVAPVLVAPVLVAPVLVALPIAPHSAALRALRMRARQ